MAVTENHPVYPPLDGSVLITDVVEHHFQHNPAQTFYAFPEENGGGDKVIEINFLEFGRAAHRAARLLRDSTAGGIGQVVAIVAVIDIVHYQTVLMGLIKAGFVPFPISPRNPPAAIVNLLKRTSCHHMIMTQQPLHALLNGIKSELGSAQSGPEASTFDLTVQDVPSFADLYPKLGCETESDPFEPVPPVPARLNDVALYLHSSGSTGFPKPIPQSHLVVLHWASCFFPPTATLESGRPIIPDPVNILRYAEKTKANTLMVVPTFLQLWSESPEAVEYLKGLEFVAFAGGALAPKVGNALVSAGVRLSPIYGGTEFGAPADCFPRKGQPIIWDWEWMKFTAMTNIRWIPQGDGTYECHVLTCKTHQPAIENLPDVKGLVINSVGRADDVIIHASGEKTVPAPMENIIMTGPFVKGALMFGREQNQAGILIETSDEIDFNDNNQIEEMKSKIWPTIEEANKGAPAFSRIFKEMILFAHPDKSLPRAAKGSIMRKASLKLYEQEIKALYGLVEVGASDSVTSIQYAPESWSFDAVEKWLGEVAQNLGSGTKVSLEDDLFMQGFDSLSASSLRGRIIRGLRSSCDASTKELADHIKQNIVYAHPTIKSLSLHLVSLVTDPTMISTTGSEEKERIEKMIETYTSGIKKIVPKSLSDPKALPSAVVLLTGSTGGLGSFILANLLGRKDVERVYAFNRPSAEVSVADRQRRAFEDRALNTDLLASEKLVLVTGNAIQSANLGLDPVLLEQIRSTVTTIIHNAWRLDFNLSLSSFEPNVKSIRHLIDFAISSANASDLRFVFVSSVASVQSWNTQNGKVPEEAVESVEAVGPGYGESKFVAEQMLTRSGLAASSVRVGQICGGPPNGNWSTTEWLPILVKTSITLGALPIALGAVSWVPAATVAQAMIDVAFSEKSSPGLINLVHPRPMSWNIIMDNIATHLKDASVVSEPISLIPFNEWCSKLEHHVAQNQDIDLAKLPAIKLLDFFRGLNKSNGLAEKDDDLYAEAFGFPAFMAQKIQSLSPAVAALRPLNHDNVIQWIDYWKSQKYI
ncbi:hypothetical protein SERLADRAFT_418199 [Serpula lacrymans var. lacrymans S7.9]|uniref:Polyketide synthase phosphopantetheine-binding domain-containing protein n=1 Tax=Serpula lacrymans var. lacrymans (strain S7.9) TaxID=578457 RepID=F8PAV5_SERL9|nr:uncharacterized protein SERLADRAFT_418199 [Serpula lacrymans var. lacrymans S7.9]EGO19943.1 hypothetical protein SERLADRAFT_418199 [Serpula lacrymans var. lacrymans S7.9]